MKEELKIKLAEIQDIEFLEKCYKLLDVEMTLMFPDVLKEEIEDEEEHTKKYWEGFISRKSGFAIIAYYNDVKIGMAVVERESERECHLEDLIILPEYRGKGISKVLVAKSKEIGKLDGYTYMSLNVLDNNVKAKKLYKSQGFSNVKSWLISEL